MSAGLNQKAYLQKYLGRPSGDKKKKKKKPAKGTGLRIIDDDIDLSKLRSLDGEQLDILDQGEDAPQIAGIIDERPEEVKKAEQFSISSKWRVINQDDGFSSKLEVEEIKSDIKKTEKENELIFGKMYSDSEDEKNNDSDISPPRKQSNENQTNTSKSSKKLNSDSEFSPLRRNNDNSPKRKDGDKSPKSKRDGKSPKRRNDKFPKRKSDDKSPKRKIDDKSPKRKTDDKSPNRRNDDRSPKKEKSGRNVSDTSPHRTEKPKERKRKPSRWGEFSPESRSQASRLDPSPKDRRNSSPQRKSRKSSPKRRSRSTESTSHRKSKIHDSDASPPRKSKKNYNSDASPPRTSKKNYDSDQSPPRISKKIHDSPQKKSRKNFDCDRSPPRKSKAEGRMRNHSAGFMSPSKKRRPSPQRQSYKEKGERYSHNSRYDKPQKHKHSSDSDMSPPRKNKRQKSVSPARQARKPLENNKRKYNSDSDQSPPRRDKVQSREGQERDRNKRSKDSPPPSNKKMAKTLDGKMAGLQDARELRAENENFRKKEEEVFNKMSDEVSGRNAQVVSRKSKRDTSEERQKQKEKAERQKELDEKYKKWSKGIKQQEDQDARVQEYLHEASKPLARLRDDRDLENNLRQVEREGDPMLKYMRDKKREKGELGPEKPTYNRSYPPNRFNLRPGYRWDGVDRSNGYEKKFFEQQSKRRAQEEESYKWSTEDL